MDSVPCAVQIPDDSKIDLFIHASESLTSPLMDEYDFLRHATQEITQPIPAITLNINIFSFLLRQELSIFFCKNV